MLKINPPSQRVFVEYFKVLRERGINLESINLTVPEFVDAKVKAAVDVGWIALDVDNADPREVMSVYRQIDEFTAEVFVDPKKSSSPSPTT